MKARRRSLPLAAIAVTAATWVLDRLPPGLVTLRAETFAGKAEVLHDTRVPEAVLVLRP